MGRYFLEVCYKGTAYAGFQVQENAETVQGKVEEALGIYLRGPVKLTGSSRTDAGVHAFQNFFHFDLEVSLDQGSVYSLNALLPHDIGINRLTRVKEGAHCRFDALSRQYLYRVYGRKDPFMYESGYYYPYSLDLRAMQEAAEAVKGRQDFSAFAKRNAQVKTFICSVFESRWKEWERGLEYEVKANRFLRGMVRGLVGTMLQVGRGKLSVGEFVKIIDGKDSSKADFSAPGKGLYLAKIEFGADYFDEL